MLASLIATIEKQHISVSKFLVTLAALTSVRFLLDAYSSGLQANFSVDNVPFGMLFFGALLLSLALFLRLLTKAPVRSILNVMLSGWVVSWIPPIVDLIYSRGQGGMLLSYILDAPANLPSRFLHFFGGPLTQEFTIGLRAEVFVAMLLLSAYVWLKTRSVVRTGIALLGTYVLFFGYAVLPTLMAVASALRWDLTRVDVISIIYTPRHVYGLFLADPGMVAGVHLSALYAILIPLQLLLLFFLEVPQKVFAFIRNVRFSRFLFQGAAYIGGIVLGVKLTGTALSPGLPEGLLLICFFLRLLEAWIFSVLLNDVEDQVIDRLTNRWRPLVVGSFSVNEFRQLAVLFGVMAAGTAYIGGFPFLTLAVAMLAFAYLYSVPPFRLRRFPFVATFVMAASVAIAILFVFIFFVPGQAFSAFPRPLIGLILVLFTLAFTVKDLKDREGDEAAGVMTLPVMLGEDRGKLATALLTAISFLLIPLFLNNRPLFFLGLGFGAIGFLLVYDKRRHEALVFVLFTVFMLLALKLAT